MPALLPGSPVLPDSMCLAPKASAPGGSLCFSLEVEEGSIHRAGGRERLAAQLSLLHSHVEALVTPQDSCHRRLQRDVHLFLRVSESEDDHLDAVVLASKLSSVGYRCSLRSALGGGAGTSCFHNLRNEFLVVQGNAGADDFIVELNFREHFSIPHPTERYAGLLGMVPSELVSTPALLAPLVQLLCSEMSLAFEELGHSLPPWRQSRSLLSKWLPSKARDVDLSPYASPRAASPELPSLLLAVPGFGLSLGAPPPGASTGPYSGSDSPGFSADSSPRAVLADASRMLLFAGRGQAPAPAPADASGTCTPTQAALRPKSLLSSSLAAGLGGGGRPLAPPQSVVPFAVPSPAQGSGSWYAVADAWEERPIRTVKMQGSGARGAPPQGL